MKKLLFLLGTLLLSLQGFSQIKFEAGYFIDNDGIKTECFIKNIDWRNNPEQFEYKLDGSTNSQEKNTNDVQEFAINAGKKYQRFAVEIDRSNNIISTMSMTREPEFEKDTLFLNVLVEGKATLYYYEEKDIHRYFFSIDDTQPIQLVYKKYKIHGEDILNDKVGENVQFKSQLWKEVNCGKLSTQSVFKTSYNKRSLIKYFIKYNKCNEVPFKDLSRNQKRNKFNLTIKSGVRYSKLNIRRNTVTNSEFDFSPKFTFTGGLEAEYILPYNKNKWSVFIEPTFFYYKNEKIDDPYEVTTQYNSIEIPIGAKYYIFLNDDSKFSIHLGYVFDIQFDSFLRLNTNSDQLKLYERNNFTFGAGYSFKNRYRVEFKYFTNRNILDNYTYLDAKFQSFGINFGYVIFQK